MYCPCSCTALNHIVFYRLWRDSPLHFIPRFLESRVAAGERIRFWIPLPEEAAPSALSLEVWDAALWTYGKDSFLPHGREGDLYPEAHPVWLTPQLEAPPDADLLVWMGLPKPAVFKAPYDAGVAIIPYADPMIEIPAYPQSCQIWTQNSHGKWS